MVKTIARRSRSRVLAAHRSPRAVRPSNRPRPSSAPPLPPKVQPPSRVTTGLPPAQASTREEPRCQLDPHLGQLIHTVALYFLRQQFPKKTDFTSIAVVETADRAPSSRSACVFESRVRVPCRDPPRAQWRGRGGRRSPGRGGMGV